MIYGDYGSPVLYSARPYPRLTWVASDRGNEVILPGVNQYDQTPVGFVTVNDGSGLMYQVGLVYRGSWARSSRYFHFVCCFGFSKKGGGGCPLWLYRVLSGGKSYLGLFGN